ncbi:putative Rab-GAP/TBC domain protein [Trachipleistophora hominis]|uniref:Putative Rab-GAP/TBC domain protein n=1 Tax=Trachipleistophora hominis TaxID=72359 RepID=L7JU02_TRAHO|nr:putative Rab-GAP/TBC domain protein [Trachipleistophora hominis]
MPENLDSSKFTLNLRELIQTYERQSADVPALDVGKNQNDLKTINVDINRNFPFYEHMADEKKPLFRNELKKTLLRLPVSYVQSMCDIVAVLMYFYLSEMTEDNSLVSLAERENTASAINMNEDDSLYDDETYERMFRTIYNILKAKYVPLIDDQFKTYLENNDIFIKMMKKRGVEIPSSKSLIYTNSTLTWFSRSADSMNDIYKIFALIISCPTSVVFLLLVHYFDAIENKKKIKMNDNDIMPKIIKLEKEFLRLQDEQVASRPKVSNKAIIFGAATGAVIAGAVLFGIFKRYK